MLDDDEEENLLFLLLSNARQVRRIKWRHERIDWNTHLEMLWHTEDFQSRYYMSEPSFDKLVDLLRSQIKMDEKQSIRSSRGNDPITPEMTVGAGLRYLGGEYIKSIADIYGMSKKSVERLVNNFLNAVCSNDELQIGLHSTELELAKCAADSDSLSSAYGIFEGTVGAIDGWLCCTETPSVFGATDYFSGHYQRYGLNVQAMCDANLRFIYFCVASPGGTNDARSFKE